MKSRSRKEPCEVLQRGAGAIAELEDRFCFSGLSSVAGTRRPGRMSACRCADRPHSGPGAAALAGIAGAGGVEGADGASAQRTFGGEQQRVAIARALINSPERSSPMNPPAIWIRIRATKSSICSARCAPNTGRRSSSPRTTPGWPGAPLPGGAVGGRTDPGVNLPEHPVLRRNNFRVGASLRARRRLCLIERRAQEDAPYRRPYSPSPW